MNELIDSVLGREVECAVQLENDPAAAAVGEQVDPSKVEAEGGRGAEAEPAGLRRRGDGAASAAECHVRPPLARCGDALHRSDHLPAATTIRRSYPRGGTSSCTSAP